MGAPVDRSAPADENSMLDPFARARPVRDSPVLRQASM
jgi:hypothetical protein